MTTNIDKIDWDNLITEIKNGNCAIILGHGLLTTPDGTPKFTQLCEQLATENAEHIHAYYEEENFFLFKALKFRRRFVNAVEEFYKQELSQAEKELYQKLAEIPVSLYVSVSADDYLKKALGDENMQHVFYGDDENKSFTAEATKDKPLIYNIFGSVSSANSIVFSHDNLYDFLKSVLGEQGLPKAVKKFFKPDAGGEVIFLGFDFSRWYVQLLLRIFNLNVKDNELSRTATGNTNITKEEEEIAQNHFQVEFVEKDCKEFIDVLHQKCKEKGLLRNLTSSKDKAIELLAEEKALRIAEIKKQIVQANRLRSELEELEMLTDNPKERMRCEAEIPKVKEKIDKLKEELNSFA
jgi:hypothetical protein